jgi:hypothetical protein
MPSDTLLKDRGMRVLSEQLGIVDAEKFITLVRRDSFNYTEWQRGLFSDVPLDTFLQNAKTYREQSSDPESA